MSSSSLCEKCLVDATGHQQCHLGCHNGQVRTGHWGYSSHTKTGQQKGKTIPHLINLNFSSEIWIVWSTLTFLKFVSCHKAQIISNWFLEHENEFTIHQWPSQSPDLKPMKHLRDVVEWERRVINVQLTNLQQLCNAIVSTRTKNLWGMFPAPYWIWSLPGTSKVWLTEWPASVHFCLTVKINTFFKY